MISSRHCKPRFPAHCKALFCLPVFLGVFFFALCAFVTASLGGRINEWHKERAAEMTIRWSPEKATSDAPAALAALGEKLRAHPDVAQVTHVNEEDVQRLLAPHLPADAENGDWPLPDLLLVTLRRQSLDRKAALRAFISEAAPQAITMEDSPADTASHRLYTHFRLAAFGVFVISFLFCLLALIDSEQRLAKEEKTTITLLDKLGIAPRTILFLVRMLLIKRLFLASSCAIALALGFFTLLHFLLLRLLYNATFAPVFSLSCWVVVGGLPLLLALLGMFLCKRTLVRRFFLYR